MSYKQIYLSLCTDPPVNLLSCVWLFYTRFSSAYSVSGRNCLLNLGQLIHLKPCFAMHPIFQIVAVM